MRIAFSGFFVDSSGYGEMSRRYLNALMRTDGIDVTPGALLADGGWQVPPDENLRMFLERRRVSKPDVHLICVAGANFDDIRPPDLMGVPRVGVMCWETDRLHEKTIEGCKTLDKLIVPSRHNQEVCAEAGIKADVIPIPVEVPTYIDELPVKGLEEVSESTFVFYDILTWQERKNPLGVLAAYFHEFSEQDDVILVLKVGGPNADQATTQAAQAANAFVQALQMDDMPRVAIVGGRWSPQTLWAFHYRGDCYVSLTRGEAFGIPMLDAAAVGNHVIATGYGGQIDFLPPATTDLVHYRMMPVLQRYTHFSVRQRWADPDLIDAGRLMRSIFTLGRQPKRLSRIEGVLPYEVGSKLKEALAL